MSHDLPIPGAHPFSFFYNIVNVNRFNRTIADRYDDGKLTAAHRYELVNTELRRQTIELLHDDRPAGLRDNSIVADNRRVMRRFELIDNVLFGMYARDAHIRPWEMRDAIRMSRESREMFCQTCQMRFGDSANIPDWFENDE